MSQKFYGYIYVTYNQQTKKVYVGQKRGLPEKSKSYLGSGMHFKKSIKKYGRQFFKKRILGTIKANSIEKLEKFLNKAEIECIYFYRSFGADGINYDDIYGYNLVLGGGTVNGYKHRECDKKRMSETKIKNKCNVREKSANFIKVDEEIEKEIINDYTIKEMSVKEISQKYNLSCHVIDRIKKEKNATKSNIKKVPNDILLKMIQDYSNTDINFINICKKYSIGKVIARREFKERNIKLNTKYYNKKISNKKLQNQIINDYKNFMTLEKIVKKYLIGVKSIKRILNENFIPERGDIRNGNKKNKRKK